MATTGTVRGYQANQTTPMSGNQNKTVLITGANGFIGRHLSAALQPDVGKLKLLQRRDDDEASPQPGENTEVIVSPNYLKQAPYDIFSGVDVVIHTAGLAHSSQENLSAQKYNALNATATKQLAITAASANVKRFIFLSSIGVSGEDNTTPFTEDDEPEPRGPYALSKLQAEQKLKEVSAETSLEYVIVRPPLVYGKGAPGNFRALVKLVATGLPLPLGAVHNRRNLCSVDNLTSFLTKAISHDQAANQLFLVSDDEAVSTKEIVQYIAEGLNKRVHCPPVPIPLMKAFGSVIGKRQLVEKLTSSLEVNNAKAKHLLGWQPPVSAREGIVAAVATKA